MFGLINHVMRVLNVGRYAQVSPLKKDQVLVNLVILDTVVSFTTTIKTPSRFIRRVNKDVRDRTAHLGMNNLSRYRLYYDDQNRILTYMVGSVYHKETTVALLESMFTHLDMTTYHLMLSTVSIMLDTLPEGTEETKIANFPNSVNVEIKDGDKTIDKYVVGFNGLSDKVIIFKLLAAMSLVNKAEKTNLSDFEIDVKYRNWLFNEVLSHYGVHCIKLTDAISCAPSPEYKNNFSFHQWKNDKFAYCYKRA